MATSSLLGLCSTLSRRGSCLQGVVLRVNSVSLVGQSRQPLCAPPCSPELSAPPAPPQSCSPVISPPVSTSLSRLSFLQKPREGRVSDGMLSRSVILRLNVKAHLPNPALHPQPVNFFRAEQDPHVIPALNYQTSSLPTRSPSA